MIEFKTGDVLAEGAETIVNAVNCVGVMGRGIALQFKRVWPENFVMYAAACRRNEVQPGRMLVFETGRSAPRFIINFPTKRHWRDKSRMEDIETGLTALVGEIRERDIKSIAMPALSAGLGGLDWAQVRNRIERAMSVLPSVRVVVFEPIEPGNSPHWSEADVQDMSPTASAQEQLLSEWASKGPQGPLRAKAPWPDEPRRTRR